MVCCEDGWGFIDMGGTRRDSAVITESDSEVVVKVVGTHFFEIDYMVLEDSPC